MIFTLGVWTVLLEVLLKGIRDFMTPINVSVLHLEPLKETMTLIRARPTLDHLSSPLIDLFRRFANSTLHLYSRERLTVSLDMMLFDGVLGHEHPVTRRAWYIPLPSNALDLLAVSFGVVSSHAFLTLIFVSTGRADRPTIQAVTV